MYKFFDENKEVSSAVLDKYDQVASMEIGESEDKKNQDEFAKV